MSDGVGITDDELEDGPPKDLHSLRARDAELNALATEVQHAAALRAAADFVENRGASSLPELGNKHILVTGSAGYLGATLYMALQELGSAVIGVDNVQSPTVDIVADVADLVAMQKVALVCGAVFHTASLHAPHASSWHERDFISTNVHGTENVLSLGLPMVHTSTTSLTVTRRVKERELNGEVVTLDENSQRPERCVLGGHDSALDAPRNKYGRTKLVAEQLCLAAASKGCTDVCILRAPRFFVEDLIEKDSPNVSLPNVKANELLGRRCALVDVVSAHLHALARIRQLSGALLTLAAPWVPGPRADYSSACEAANQIRAHYSQLEPVLVHHGWQLPDAVTRIYDGTAATHALGWKPRVTFETVLRSLQRASAACHNNSETVVDQDDPQHSLQPTAYPSIDDVLRGAY